MSQTPQQHSSSVLLGLNLLFHGDPQVTIHLLDLNQYGSCGITALFLKGYQGQVDRNGLGWHPQDHIQLGQDISLLDHAPEIRFDLAFTEPEQIPRPHTQDLTGTYGKQHFTREVDVDQTELRIKQQNGIRKMIQYAGNDGCGIAVIHA